MFKTLPALDLLHNIDKPIDEILPSPPDTKALNPVFEYIKNIELSTLTATQGYRGDRKAEQLLKNLHNLQVELKRTLDRILTTDSTLIEDAKAYINESLENIESIIVKLEGLIKIPQFTNHFKNEIKNIVDVDNQVVKVLKWLLNFLKASVAMHEEDYSTACQIFSILTDPKDNGFKLIQHTLQNDVSEEDIRVFAGQFIPTLSRQLPQHLIEQCEKYKVEAYTKSLVEGHRAKIKNILSEYLESSFLVMKATTEAVKKSTTKELNIPSNIYQPLLDALSNKASANLLTYIAGELILLSNYDEALDLLKDASNSLKKSNSENVNLKLDIIYNTCVAYLYSKQYGKLIELALDLIPKTLYKHGRYADIEYLIAEGYKLLGNADEALRWYFVSVEHNNNDSLIRKTSPSMRNEWLTYARKVGKEVVLFNFLEKILLQKGIPQSTQEEEIKNLEKIINVDTIIHAQNNNQKTFLHDAADLFQAIERDNIGLVKEIVNSGTVNANTQNEYLETALHKATTKGNIEVVKYLIEQGAKPDISNIFQQTPLRLAVLKGHFEVTKLLLEKGADPNAKNKTGLTALHIAAEKGNKDILELLVQNKGSINITNNYGDNILHSAARGIIKDNDNCWEVIKWALEHKADFNLEKSVILSIQDIFERVDYSYVEQFNQLLGEHTEL